jgi:hypothetical protein
VALGQPGNPKRPIVAIFQEQHAHLVPTKFGFAVYDLPERAHLASQRSHHELGICRVASVEHLVDGETCVSDDAPAATDVLPR